MNEKHGLSPEQIQARLKNLQQGAGHESADGGGRDVEITVASQRDAFDLKACRALLQENGIASRFLGHGFNQVVVVSREDSSRAIDVIAAHRERLLRKNPLSAGDYIVGVLAWAFGCGMGIPAAVGLAGLYFRLLPPSPAITFAILVGVSVMLGGFLGYLRCYMIASRRRR